MRWKFAIAVMALVCFVASTISAQTPSLHGKYIRMNVKGFGFNVDANNTAKRSRGLYNGTSFMLVTFENGQYVGKIASEIQPNVWQETAQLTFFITLADGGLVLPDGHVILRNERGQFVSGYGTHLLLPVIKNGSLKNVLMSSWGEVISGSLNPTSVFYGGYQIKGRAVPIRSVPSAVIAALPLP